MIDIYGEGGKGGGGHTPVEADDTLSSKQTIRLLFALSEGEIESVDDILINSASASNYASSISYQVKTGTVDQTVINGFSEVEAPITGAGTFPVNLLYNVEHVYSLLGTYDAARLTLMIDRLMQITSQGDRVGYSASLSIYKRHQPYGGTPSTWQLAASITKSGKCTNPYTWDVRIEKPELTLDVDTWGIRIIRDSVNDADDRHYSKTYLSAITTITEAALTYPKTALVGVTITDAKQFNGQIPEIKFKPKGIKFPLPSNYNPVTRHYDETVPWNGSFKSYNEYTNNLAWVIYWVLRNADWGMDIAGADVDLGAFYTFAKYCDELVDNGKGGTEPRFTINHQFVERDSVPQFLMYLLNLGNANFATNEFGQIKVVWDGYGQQITKIITNANVIDGLFQYSSNDLESRTNLVNVTYMREELLGDSDTANFYDQTLIDRYGLQTADVILAGCTSEGQALRKARWTLYNNCYLTEIITFKQLFQGADYSVGDLISIMDSDNVTVAPKHAVIAGYSYSNPTTTITLDRSVVLDNYDYHVEFIDEDGTTFHELSIPQKNGTFSTITYLSSVVPFVAQSIIFKSIHLEPRLAKVVKVEKDENEIYSVTAVQHSEAKYTYVDNIGTIPQPSTSGSYVNFDNYTIPAVTDIAVQQVFATNGVVEFNKLTVSWLWSTPVGVALYVPTFDISYRRDNQEFVRVRGLQATEFDIDYAVPGVYEIYIWAVNPFTGLKSVNTYLLYNYRITSATSTLLPPTSVVVPNTSGVSFSGRNLVLEWAYNTANDAVKDSIRDYVVEVLTSANVVKGTYTVPLNANKGGSFTLSFDENSAIFGSPTRSFNVRVYSRDTVGDLSTYIAVSPINPAPVVTTFDASAVFNAAYLKATIPTDTDLVSYTFKQYDASSGGTLLASISSTSNYLDFQATAGTTYYYSVTPYDVYGAGTETTRVSVSALSIDADTYTYTGLVFKPNDPSNNSVSWTSFVATKNGTTSVTVNSGNAAWTTGIIYLYYIPNNTTLQATTSLVTAVSGRILATYKGGTDLTSDSGRAFTSGDMVLAGTIGSNQLVTGSAVITQSAQIGNILQSDNYSNSGTFTGWRLDKTGTLYANSISLKDSAGNTIFASGTGFNWNNVTGTNVPAANATVGATWGTNISNQPTSLSGINSTEGTKLASIATGATANASLSGAGAPSAGTGQTGDSYFDTTTGLMYWKQSTGWSKVVPQITNSNVSTFIASAAIGQTQIGNAAIGTAQIGDAQITNAKIDRASIDKLQVVTADIVDASVETLKIAGNAVTIPLSAFTSGSLNVSAGVNTTIQTLTTGVLSTTVSTSVIISFGATIKTTVSASSGSIELDVDGIMAYYTVIYVSTGVPVNPSLTFSSSYKIDVPANTSKTITIILNISSSNGSVNNRYINLLAVKR